MRTVLATAFTLTVLFWTGVSLLPSAPKAAAPVAVVVAPVAPKAAAPAPAPVARPFIGLGETTHRIKNSEGVVDALMTDGGSYWISMYNKGGSYKGYAEYACGEMPQGIRTTITIWDAAEMYGRDNLVALAKHYCDKK